MEFTDSSDKPIYEATAALLCAPADAPRAACRAFVRQVGSRAEFDALLGIACDRSGHAFFEDWRGWLETGGRDIAVLGVDNETRSTAATAEPGTNDAAVVRGVPIGEIASLPETAATYLDEWRRAAVVVEGVSSLVSAAGIDTVVDVIDRLSTRVRTANGRTYAVVPDDASPQVVDALAPLFDAVVDLDRGPDGEIRARRRAGSLPVLPPDLVFDLLAPPRRRYALYHLVRGSTPISVEELADRVVRLTDGSSDADRRKRALVGLLQVDLPKLRDADVVSYDEPGDVVRLGRRSRALRPYLALAARSDLPGGALPNR